MSQKLDKKLGKSTEIKLLLQAYSRYVSMAHTIFGAFCQIFFAIIFGTIGIIISLVEAKIIPWNKYFFIIFITIDLIIIGIVLITAYLKWYNTRTIRSKIVSKIIKLDSN